MPNRPQQSLKKTPNSTADLQFIRYDRVGTLDPKTNGHGTVRDPAPRASKRRALP
jgi:hypothetical protein